MGPASSACTSSGTPALVSTGIARRSTPSSTCGKSSTPDSTRKHLNATHPASASARSSATLPGTTPPVNATSTASCPSVAAAFASNAASVVVGGDALSGMSTIVVTPPAAAARVAVAKPSHSLRPGSLTCTCVSTRPGMSTRSPTSSTGTPAGIASHASTRSMTPPVTWMLAGARPGPPFGPAVGRATRRERKARSTSPTLPHLRYDHVTMRLRLTTVRAKLTALVAMSAVVMLAALPVLSWLLHRQLVDEVDDRVTEAERAFQTELDDDLADLTLASRILSADDATARAIEQHDAARARQLASVFVGVYPNIDVLLVDARGHVLAQVGCEHPRETVEGIPELADLVHGKEFRGVVEHGCETSAGAPPAYVIAQPIAGVGGVVLCEPVDADYLKNSSAKLGLELALAVIDPSNEHQLVGQTQDFPQGALASAPRTTTAIVEAGDRSWAVQRFEPRQLKGRVGAIGMVAALDVTDIHTIVQRNLAYALGILAVAALVSMAFGWRVASVMSGALKRVNTALKRVDQLDYVHVQRSEEHTSELQSQSK